MFKEEQKKDELRRSPGVSNARQVASHVLAAVGTEFCESLVKNLAEALDADCVYLGEFVGGKVERLRTLAVAIQGNPDGRFDHYPLAGSLAAQVAVGEPCTYTRGVLKKFPDDVLLLETDAQAAVAVPLLDSNRQSLGVLMAVYRRALPNARLPKSMLETFAPRASAELQRMQSEAAVRESAQRYHAFIAQNPDAMWRIELERPIDTSLPDQEQIEQLYRYGYLAECNDALARLLGYERSEELIGASFEQLARHADRRLPEQIQTAIHSGYRLNTMQVEVLGPDGTKRQRLRTHWGVVEDGMLVRIWGTVRDITELRRAEEALAATRQRLAELLEKVRLVTVMLDNDGAVTFCSDYALRLTGWQADEVAGKNWFDLMVPPEEREQLREAFAATRVKSPYPHHFESTLMAKDGRRWMVGWESTILRDSEGRVNGIAGVGRDITAYKALDATVRQAQMLETFGRTADKIARDFSDLLVIITGYCAALIPDLPETDPAYRALNEIKESAERGVGLSQQLMALGRRQMLVPKPLNLNTLIEQVGRTLGPLLGEDITFTLQLDPKLGLIRGDTDQLRQVLFNLALSARDRLPEGGNLIISSTNAELDDQRASELSGVAPGSYVLMSVTDTGAGMAEMAKAYLFEPLFTMPEEGKTDGLGLSTLHEIVQQNGGLVVVETELEMQTTFHLYFPRVQLTG
jgi:hypothetical protein